MGKQQESWQKNCAKWVNVSERIEADTAEPRRRFITTRAGDVSVSRFMKCDGDKDRK